jgi:hypothetical protein
MTVVALSPPPKLQFFGTDGNPLVGGKVYTYAAGTTTPLATYVDSAGVTVNTNPIILDTRGEANIWLTSAAYKLVLRTSTDTLIWTVDNITSNAYLIGLLDAFKADLANTSDVAKGDALVGFKQSNATGILTNAVGRTVHQKLQETVSVFDFGAKGDGTTDDTTAVQNALNSGAGNVYFPTGTYKIATGLTVACSIYGDGQGKSTISSTATIDYMLSVSGRRVISNLSIMGNGSQSACVKLTGANGTLLQTCQIEGAKYDNVSFASTGNNSSSVIDTCLIRNCGTTYTTGTASGSSGSTTVTISGAANLTTLGIRSGVDYVYFSGDAGGYAFEIQAVGASSLTIYPPLNTTLSSSAFRIIQGSNVNILRNADNSRITVRSSTLQAAKVAGIQDDALYGCVSINNVIETNSYGRVIGNRGAGDATFDALEVGNYYEGSTYKDILYAYAVGELVRISGSGNQTSTVFSGSLYPMVLANDPVGTWTPVDASPAALTFTGVSGTYYKIGHLVTAQCTLTYPITVTANAAFIGGLPYAQGASAANSGGFVSYNTSATQIVVDAYSANVVQIKTPLGASVANSSLSAATIRFTFVYMVDQ